MARAERWITSTGGAITRRAAPSASSRPQARASAYVRASPSCSRWARSARRRACDPRVQEAARGHVACAGPAGRSARRTTRPSIAPSVSSPSPRRPGDRVIAARQRGACRGASEADGAGAATVTRMGRLWPARTRKRPRKASTVVRRARRPAPIRFAMPRRAPRVRALPTATRGRAGTGAAIQCGCRSCDPWTVSGLARSGCASSGSPLSDHL